jgi:uncharacterized membrane-anchored protein YjiN (DUF445 family)
MNKTIELKKAKRTPILLLLVAACIFVVTAFMPRGFWVDGIKAVAEAAMVGALADWFAVAPDRLLAHRDHSEEQAQDRR